MPMGRTRTRGDLAIVQAAGSVASDKTRTTVVMLTVWLRINGMAVLNGRPSVPAGQIRKPQFGPA